MPQYAAGGAVHDGRDHVKVVERGLVVKFVELRHVLGARRADGLGRHEQRHDPEDGVQDVDHRMWYPSLSCSQYGESATSLDRLDRRYRLDSNSPILSLDRLDHRYRLAAPRLFCSSAPG